MSLRRFEAIMSAFHISNRKSPPKGQPGYDPWVKVCAFVDAMNEAFLKYFVPNQEICIDESMIGMKNRCIFIQYMPNKRHSRFGIKKFELCDSRSGYVLQSVMYSGKDFLAEGTPAFTEKVVEVLMTRCGLFDKRYHLFTDNYYTKLPLARFLSGRLTYLTGTIRKDSKELPKTVRRANLDVGETLYFRKGLHRRVLLVKYKERKTRKPVHLITTACHAENVEQVNRNGRRTSKPVLIHRYNQFMGGVDCKDKSIYHVTCSRQTKRYWRKIVYNFTDMAILNAYRLYCLSTQGRQLSRLDFMLAISGGLANPQPIAHQQNVLVPPARVHGIHECQLVPNKGSRLCVVCQDRGVKKRSYTWCEACNVGVHRLCFRDLQHFRRPQTRGGRRGQRNEAQGEQPVSPSDSSD